MMNSKSRGFLAKVLMLTLCGVLAPLTSAFAERLGRQPQARYELRAVGQESSMRGTIIDIAKTNGYNDGKQAGINDHKRGQPSNFRDEQDYKKATKGYSPKLGHKEQYKRAYRMAFENGYRDGWNGY